MYVPPFVLVPTPASYDWVSLFRFMHRQYLLIRVYAPGHWWFAAWTLIVPALGAAFALARSPTHGWALGFIAASLTLLQLRLALRGSIARQVLAPAAMPAALATVKFARWAWPLIHLIHLAAFVSSALGRRFSWAGVRYLLDGREVRVTGRS
jgi:hypothetical protein